MPAQVKRLFTCGGLLLCNCDGYVLLALRGIKWEKVLADLSAYGCLGHSILRILLAIGDHSVLPTVMTSPSYFPDQLRKPRQVGNTRNMEGLNISFNRSDNEV